MIHMSKNDIHEALDANNLPAVASLAKEDKKVLSQLIRLAYDKETLVGWRAIKAIGLAARELVKSDDEFLRVTIRKLLWSLSDESGGIGWSAPEIIGEIVSADPARFRDIIPLIAEVYDIEEKVFRPGILYAMTRIAEVNPGLVLPFIDLAKKGLCDDAPLVRVNALELTSVLKKILNEKECDEIRASVKKLLADHSEVWVYKKDGFVNVEVSEKARLACL